MREMSILVFAELAAPAIAPTALFASEAAVPRCMAPFESALESAVWKSRAAERVVPNKASPR